MVSSVVIAIFIGPIFQRQYCASAILADNASFHSKHNNFIKENAFSKRNHTLLTFEIYNVILWIKMYLWNMWHTLALFIMLYESLDINFMSTSLEALQFLIWDSTYVQKLTTISPVILIMMLNYFHVHKRENILR